MLIKVGEEGFNTLRAQLIHSTLQVPPFYSELNRLYQQKYYEHLSFTDVSFLICEQDIPLMGVVASVSQLADGTCELSNFGSRLLILTNDLIPIPNLGKLEKLLISEIEKTIDTFKVKYLKFTDLLNQGISSYFTHHWMMQGAVATPRFTCIINLSLSEQELHHSLRKRYKSFINWGKKNLTLKVLDYSNITWLDIEACRNLHIEAAGRITRNLQTWKLQYEMIKNQEAFIITGEMSGEMVTFGFFLYSEHYCYYGVSASKRELFDKPIFHVIMWQAILFAKQLGCKYFETGDIIYPKKDNVTKKEIDIGKFKKGFGGEVKVVLDVSWRKG
ncbi:MULTISPECIES: hypothetical protein [Cyanophyceae]|uniref:hypothetical protein n=1 Tax=Cyanophyceae TaxID=3028117 RepID=UPI0016829290|nr:hypothetical protein [Trichocoleus sp. FACHB-40]MBD2002368.1 hypothetical protein [Trichocoleus sp. FACHB-40]